MREHPPPPHVSEGPFAALPPSTPTPRPPATALPRATEGSDFLSGESQCVAFCICLLLLSMLLLGVSCFPTGSAVHSLFPFIFITEAYSMGWIYPPLMAASILGQLGMKVLDATHFPWHMVCMGNTRPVYSVTRVWSHSAAPGTQAPCAPTVSSVSPVATGSGAGPGGSRESQVVVTTRQWINSSLKFSCLNHLHGHTSACAGLNGSSGRVLLALLK